MRITASLIILTVGCVAASAAGKPFTTGLSQLRVVGKVATLQVEVGNVGSVEARNVQLECVFTDRSGREIDSATGQLKSIAAGETALTKVMADNATGVTSADCRVVNFEAAMEAAPAAAEAK